MIVGTAGDLLSQGLGGFAEQAVAYEPAYTTPSSSSAGTGGGASWYGSWRGGRVRRVRKVSYEEQLKFLNDEINRAYEELEREKVRRSRSYAAERRVRGLEEQVARLQEQMASLHRLHAPKNQELLGLQRTVALQAEELRRHKVVLVVVAVVAVGIGLGLFLVLQKQRNLVSQKRKRYRKKSKS